MVRYQVKYLRQTLIKGMKDEWVETLNLMGKGDIYQETYDDIVLLCIRCSRGSSRTRSGMRIPLTRNSNTTSGGVTRAEVGNLLENFKTDILSTLTTQLDVLQAKQKKIEAEQTLAIFFHRCRRKHGPRDFPLDVVQVCAICAKDHDTEQCPSLPGLKVVFREAEEETKSLYLMAQHRQWQNRPPNTLQDPSSFFSGQYNQQQAPGSTWQGQSFTNQNWQPQQYPPANPTWKNQPAANPAWQNQPTAISTWPNSQYPTSSWKNSNNNIYPSQWPNMTTQNPNWNQNWQHPMGINNQPMGMAPQTQPTLQAPLQLPQNPQSQLRPQLPAQPHPNPNNRPTQLIQIMENGEGETSSVGCNELRLRSGHIISPEENNIFQEQENEKQPTITPSTVVITEEIEQGGNTVESQDLDKDATPSPLFPERLMIAKSTVYPNFDIVGELKNLYIKIPLLQALQDIPIYAKMIKELCGRKPIRKIKDPSSTVRVVGALSDLILGRQEPVKYADPGNPIVTVQIQGCSFPNTLVDLGAAINILTMETCNTLGFDSFEPTAIMLQLADRSVVRPVGTLHDIAIFVDSWEYWRTSSSSTQEVDLKGIH
jgi:hypothetical protein